jgi:opacity protein-like surface antigen
MSTVPSLATRAFLFMAALVALVAGAAHAADHPLGSIDFTLGSKQLSSDWALGQPSVSTAGDTTIEQHPHQPGLGVETSWGKKGWPVSIALDVMHSYDDGLEQFTAVNLGVDTIKAASARRRASTLEIGVGVRRAWIVKGWSPYVGGGGSWIHATVIDEIIDPSIGPMGGVVGGQRGSDSSFGYWIGGGIVKRVGPRFHLGLTARFSKAKVTLPSTQVVGEVPTYHYTGTPQEVEAGGRHIGFVIGWSFPDTK